MVRDELSVLSAFLAVAEGEASRGRSGWAYHNRRSATRVKGLRSTSAYPARAKRRGAWRATPRPDDPSLASAQHCGAIAGQVPRIVFDVQDFNGGLEIQIAEIAAARNRSVLGVHAQAHHSHS